MVRGNCNWTRKEREGGHLVDARERDGGQGRRQEQIRDARSRQISFVLIFVAVVRNFCLIEFRMSDSVVASGGFTTVGVVLPQYPALNNLAINRPYHAFRTQAFPPIPYLQQITLSQYPNLTQQYATRLRRDIGPYGPN